MHSSSTFTFYARWAAVFLCWVICLAAHAENITLIGEDSWYPYSGVKNGKNRGFAVDVIKAAYASKGIDVKFISTPYSRCLMLVKTGQELGCFDSLRDTKLEPDFLFHKEAIFKASVGIYARANSPHAHVEHLLGRDLHKHVIGVTHGYTYGSEFENDTHIVRESAPSDLSNLRKLLLGRSDFSLVYSRIVDYLVTMYPDELKGKIVKVGTLVDDNLYVSFSKNRPESGYYADALDEGLRKIRANGIYASLEKKWANPEP